MSNEIMSAALENEDQTCPAIGYQRVSVCVPVTISPYAKTYSTITKCCGDPIVVSGESSACKGVKNGTCSFTISQTICVAVPVDFGAKATVGDTYVDCLGASADNICENCTDEEE